VGIYVKEDYEINKSIWQQLEKLKSLGREAYQQYCSSAGGALNFHLRV